MKAHELESQAKTLAELESLAGLPGVLHPRFGDLSRGDAVVAPGAPIPEDTHVERDDMIVHLTVTGKCNARCQGCVNTVLTSGCGRQGIVDEFESVPERDAQLVAELARFARGDDLSVALYGGEPLLEPDRLVALMNRIESMVNSARVRFMVYTNGQLLRSVVDSHPELWRNVFLVSVSVDGRDEQHTRHRPGTDVPAIRAGLERLCDVYAGEVLFWSTLREEQSLIDCFQQYEEFHRQGLVTQMFWHWVDSPEPYAAFDEYLLRYGAEFEMVMVEYVRQLRRGLVPPLCHVNELVLYLLEGTRRGHSACAVELAENFDIVGGRVTACADLPLSIGELPSALQSQSLPDLSSLVAYRSVLGCDVCGVGFYCGGRCPVQVLAGSPLRTRQVCQLMRLHVGIVAERLTDISRAMRQHGIGVQDLYERSAYVARYTDVVP